MKLRHALAFAFVFGCSGGGKNNPTPDGSITVGSGDDAAQGPSCGNGKLDFGEDCDDGNTMSNDGCSSDCHVETGFACGQPGNLCLSTHTCGNGIVEPTEGCDDRNTNSGDGCSAQCQLEAGWTCSVAGIRCSAAQCGDGIVAGFEACDDGNGSGGDGCSANCQLEVGFKCPTAGATCAPTHCGDGVAEGLEECDDGNNDLGDGCDPLCHREPQCAAGVCTAVCGDGVLQTGEACDDGNTNDFDGCSSQCSVETGFACVAVTDAEPSTFAVTIVYRDFRGHDLTGGHIDFENHLGDDRGIVASTLGADHKAQYGAHASTSTTASSASFDDWYRDSANNMTYSEQLVLNKTAPGTYIYDNGSFFPLDGRGFVGLGTEPARTAGNHNFSFTSELRYWFVYKGGEVLSFRGDDDVWVFINGKLAIDLGGVHSAENASITLDAAHATTLSLTVNGTYEVVVLQAERHTTASSYKLTLQGFNAPHSSCDDTCGDGVTSSNEVCDDGVNMGGYNSCTADCLGFGPRCGDAIVQAQFGEECDEGTNVGGYNHCQPNCTLGPRCGDGIVQTANGEACDDANNDPTDGCDMCVQPIQ